MSNSGGKDEKGEKLSLTVDMIMVSTVGAQRQMRNRTIICSLRKQKLGLLEVVVVDEVRVKACQSDQTGHKYSCCT